MKKTAALPVAALALAAALGLTACGDSTGPGIDVPGSAAVEGEWRGQVSLGDEIEIKGISGNIEAFMAVGQEVVVLWKKQGRHNDPADVTIDVVRHVGGVTICAVYPDVPGERKNECGPGQAGHMTTRENDVSVDFVVLVPAGVDFYGRTISGDVLAEDLQSNAFGSTITGDVHITTSELAEASTISGSVTVKIGRSELNRDLEFSAISGSVAVSVPANTSAEVWASTTSGTVSSDFELPRLDDGSLRGTIGDGGGMLRLSTVTGSVRLRRAS